MRVESIIAIAVVAVATTASAQVAGGGGVGAGAGGGRGGAAGTFSGQMPRIAVEARVTPGVPYSAEAVTESVQVLSDGNRIARKDVTRIYRDSEGRTRREQIGTSGEADSITISDPVSESAYVLIPKTKLAYRNGVVMVSGRGSASASVEPGSSSVVVATRTPDGNAKVTAYEPSAEAGSGQAGAEVRGRAGRTEVAGAGRGGPSVVAFASTGIATPGVPAESGEVTNEDLGQQMIEGLTVSGTRTTTVIPAGRIGNEQPIRIVSEQWYSPELKVLVLTKHSDPRTGETTYRLTAVTQSEPARTLFEVPSDYVLKDSVIRRQSPSMQ
jgi:hypothetical protein